MALGVVLVDSEVVHLAAAMTTQRGGRGTWGLSWLVHLGLQQLSSLECLFFFRALWPVNQQLSSSISMYVVF